MEERDDARDEMEKLEEGDPPEELGPSGVRYHEDGSVTIDRDPVDNPEDYQGDPDENEE